MSAVQASTVECDCGDRARVTPTESAYEFDWVCACGRFGTLSWLHSAAAPRWEPPEEIPEQGDLFTGQACGMGER